MLKIAVIRFGKLGDTLLCAPVFKNLKQHLPTVRADFYLSPQAVDLVAADPHIDTLFPVNKKALKKARNFLKFVFFLKNKKYDCVLLLQNSLSSALICFAAGIPMRAGYSKQGRRIFLTHPFMEKDRYSSYEVDRNLKLLKVLGIKPRDRSLKLYLSKWQKNRLKLFETENFTKRHGFFCVAPFASTDVRLWPLKNYISLINRIQERYGIRPVIIAAPFEKNKVEKILAGVPNALDTSSMNLSTRTAVISGARLMICPNTGPMHIAHALGVPVIALFGPQSEKCWGHEGKAFHALTAECNCRPCNKHVCTREKVWCMDEIGVKKVYNKCVDILETPEL